MSETPLVNAYLRTAQLENRIVAYAVVFAPAGYLLGGPIISLAGGIAAVLLAKWRQASLQRRYPDLSPMGSYADGSS